MSFALHMVELQLDIAALFRFLGMHRLNDARDEDLGYGVHAWLSAVFGSQTLKPFRVLHDRRGRPLRLLAYSSRGKEGLVKHAREFASPSALAVCDLEKDLHTKAMPERWEAGRKLAIRVLACPVSRKDGIEKDVFLRAADRVGEEHPLDRATIYCDWVARQLEPCARVDAIQLERFRMVRQLRRGDARRPGKLVRPSAEISGIVEVKDHEQFAHALARGIGRHRSFGYGMLLLSPVR